MLLPAISLLVSINITAQKLNVPVGGNSWVIKKDKNDLAEVTDSGWINWNKTSTAFVTYIDVAQKGSLHVYISGEEVKGKSIIQCIINGITKKLSLTGKLKDVSAGEWMISKPGYIKIEIKGIQKSGDSFASINRLSFTGICINNETAFVKNNDDNYFYWGRRGPSVHLNYPLPDTSDKVEWFYNEITVPKGNDVIGSYFMANGFGEGYFGIQVNSSTERRVLFSVWSPYTTDDPNAIPEDKKIILVKKGKDVVTAEFGNEGSGGQSFLRYNWKAGVNYKFLSHAVPVENNYTNYTSYFFAPELNQWLLIASFNRPYTNTYLTKLHSFLENFEPEKGNITRKAFYHNQWIKTSKGEWKPLTIAKFTGDATAKKAFRLDYSGGIEKGKFFLRNCGFFNDSTKLNSVFEVDGIGEKPVINLTTKF
jgi:hypothetical protein